MTVNKLTTTAMVLGALASTALTANASAHGNAYGHRAPPAYVYARVVDVDPVVRYVAVDRPHEECWNETVRQPVAPFGVAGQTAAGGVIGAAIGRQFGGGDTRDALTLMGAVAGAAVAHERAIRNGAYETRDATVQRCRTVNERVSERVVDGYLVTYVYDGRHYTMRTAEPPGDRVRLAVDLRPVGYRVGY